MTGIYVYSFALNPEQHQPSGSVNMSRIDNATLNLTLTTGTQAIQLRLYTTNYNVLYNMGLKVNLEINLLMKKQCFFVTLSKCEKLLKLIIPKLNLDLIGQEIELGYGNNLLNWTIRSKFLYKICSTTKC